jgi:hypothetical protein
MPTRISLAAILLLGVTPVLSAQTERLRVGVLLGSTSDYTTPSSDPLAPAVEGRQLSLGVPVRVRLTAPSAWTLSLLGSVEWSYAGDGAPTDGLTQFALGPELQRTLAPQTDVRLGALAGLMTRRNDAFDQSMHRQMGFEAGAGFALSGWRLGYSYRQAWVSDARQTIRGCAGGVRTACVLFLQQGPARTLGYNRHALVVDRAF